MEIGQKVEHVLTKDWMLVLEIIDSPDRQGIKILCRTKDLREVWFNEFELKVIK